MLGLVVRACVRVCVCGEGGGGGGLLVVSISELLDNLMDVRRDVRVVTVPVV